MEDSLGYRDSQTWQAWLESCQVVWNNTSLIFLVSIGTSLVVVFLSLLIRRESDQHPWKEGTKKLSKKEYGKDEWKGSDGEQEKMDVDKVLEYSQHIAGQFKRAKQHSLEKTIETQMSEEQKQAEKEARSEQLKAIFRMMQEQEEKFGETTMDEIKDQMKLYCG